MIVEVKQEHIDEGTQGCPCYCAVSLAVYEVLKDKYKFSHTILGDDPDDRILDGATMREEVKVGESWVETALQGSGAEISIYTKLENKVVEDIIVIEDELSMNNLVLERWIDNFDLFDDSKPISFNIEDIHRMQQ